MQASHLRFMERRTFDNISGVFRISSAAALMRTTSSSALFYGCFEHQGFHLPPEEIIQTGMVWRSGRPMHWTSTANLSFTTCCIQVIPNRNTEMCGAPSCWNHMGVRVAAVTCALSNNSGKTCSKNIR
ncbi:hypothetical protein TNCV_4388671 [Trichonephila clavipes]|nr:hypothetical protein TNCV_4388671 [Trichonephila clavipes]